MQRRIKRNYRQMSPAKFLVFCKKVRHCLTDNSHFPDATWGASAAIRQQLFEALDKLEVAYHLAVNGDRILIRDRDKLIAEIILMLDEIASHLEAACVRNPDALFTTGFAVTEERRTSNRTKQPLTASTDFIVLNTELQGRAIGSASAIPGAYNHEIHINKKDPSVEEDWFHKAIFHDPSSMVMDNLETGNMCFRLRHHGPDGPGPWSTIVSTFIT